ncbi:MAG: (deoxy)nucleoside triphosphate pyrophosphohydrolase [Proteobacteria bacterium]|jgi:8-oxo-dGTP diphosphatase|nr:(deoxy)nucleoside triphosphate pyrophosphohydrolase [Pseudomonadota bacterium]
MGNEAIRVVSAEIEREGVYLITQRSAKAVLPLLWEFPGGRVHQEESDMDALVRNLRARLGVVVDVGEKLMEVEHTYDNYSLTLVVYRGSLGDQEPRPIKVNALAWVAPEDFGDYPFPGADQQTVDALLGYS